MMVRLKNGHDPYHIDVKIRHSQKMFRVMFRWVLSSFLVGIFTFTGCSNKTLEKRAEPPKKWVCNSEADEAIKRHDYEMGISLHKRFLRNQPGNALALYHLGYAYGRIGDQSNEVSYYKQAISLGFKENHIFFNLGLAYIEMDQIDEAINAFKEALEMDPKNAEYHYGLALAYLKNGTEDLAKQEALKALKMDPEHSGARMLLDDLGSDDSTPDKSPD